jgi:hypothetical protein
MKHGFECGPTTILGLKYMTADGVWHFCPAKEYRDKYLDAYINSQKIMRPVSKITKELKP